MMLPARFSATDARLYRSVCHRWRVGGPRPVRSASTELSSPILDKEAAGGGAAELLSRWITDNGGYIHPALVVMENAPCGSRGLVALRAITAEEAAEPLVVVPEHCLFTYEAALAELQRLLAARPGSSASSTSRAGGPLAQLAALLPFGGASRQPSIDPASLDPVMVVGVMLAHERSKGRASFWGAYIESLPQQPCNPWAMDAGALEAALQQLPEGTPIDQWRKQVQAAATAVRGKAERLERAYADVLHVTADDIIWGMSQVVSRAFGLVKPSDSGAQTASLACAPFIDLVNHAPGRGRPDGLFAADGTACVCIRSELAGQALALQAGQEFYICYGDTNMDNPLMAFLNLGFVPYELHGRLGGSGGGA